MDQPKRKRTYAQIQQMIREEAPAIFLWTQYDTLAISKKVQYAARAGRVALALRRQAGEVTSAGGSAP